ncbi:MAG: response regulator [Candidatus Omnitrophota bacterium]|nr:response regulator [Candidatus Omnitrophota bacterium]
MKTKDAAGRRVNNKYIKGIKMMEKILIIDDDPDIVEAMKVVLESRNYRVSVARTGEEGLREVRRDKPELIILDVMMETGDKGFDVAREIKRDPNYKDVPILMLTAIKERTGLDFGKEAGDEHWLPVDDYCDKPLHPDELVSKVETLLKKKR